MNYIHRFRVEAPLAAVVAFHQAAASMAAITPPPLVVKMHQAPNQLQEGDDMAFTLWLGPLPIDWQARIEQVTPISFVDRQVAGPFAEWLHLHTFVPIDAGTTEVVDRVQATLKPHGMWRLVGLSMWLTLPLLFAYRAWQTRRILGRQPLPNTKKNKPPLAL
jgi:ligand-binding SRPBCC domain-containing protein